MMGSRANTEKVQSYVLSPGTAHSILDTAWHQQQAVEFTVSAHLKELVPYALALESFVHIEVQDAIWLNLNVHATLLNKETLASRLQASKDKDPAGDHNASFKPSVFETAKTAKNLREGQGAPLRPREPLCSQVKGVMGGAQPSQVSDGSWQLLQAARTAQ